MVGGCVRDLLLQLNPRITTSRPARPRTGPRRIPQRRVIGRVSSWCMFISVARSSRSPPSAPTIRKRMTTTPAISLRATRAAASCVTTLWHSSKTTPSARLHHQCAVLRSDYRAHLDHTRGVRHPQSPDPSDRRPGSATRKIGAHAAPCVSPPSSTSRSNGTAPNPSSTSPTCSTAFLARLFDECSSILGGKAERTFELLLEYDLFARCSRRAPRPRAHPGIRRHADPQRLANTDLRIQQASR